MSKQLYNPGPPGSAPPSGYNQVPPPGGYNQVPPPGGYNQVPPPSGYNQAPPPGGYNQAPPPGGYNQAPPPGGFNQAPPPGGYNQAPPPGGYNPGPPAGAYTPGPPSGYNPVEVPPGYNPNAPPPTGYATQKPPQYVAPGFQAAYSHLANVNEFKVQQSFKFWEAISQGCCEQLNTYKVFDAQNPNNEIMILQEEAEFCTRCCCSPYHTYKVGMFGNGENPEMIPKEGGLSAMTDRPVLIEREGCFSKLLCCFSCSESCANHADVLVTGTEEQGNRQVTYRFEEKICNGCTPEIVIISSKSNEPVAIIAGPTIFGGCSELCVEYDYTITTFGENIPPGDIAKIEKKKPQGFMQMMQEAFTDSDNYELHFNPNSKFAGDAEFKAVVLAVLVYLDYMFFEYDNGMCEPTAKGGCKVTLFNCYVYGCICPCQLTCEKGDETEG